MTEHKAEDITPTDSTGIPAETMADYAEELEASFKKVKGHPDRNRGRGDGYAGASGSEILRGRDY